MDLTREDLGEREGTAHRCDFIYCMDDQNSLPIGALDATESISTGRLSRRPDVPTESQERRHYQPIGCLQYE
jgi:hypothetical protein